MDITNILISILSGGIPALIGIATYVNSKNKDLEAKEQEQKDKDNLQNNRLTIMDRDFEDIKKKQEEVCFKVVGLESKIRDLDRKTDRLDPLLDTISEIKQELKKINNIEIKLNVLAVQFNTFLERQK